MDIREEIEKILDNYKVLRYSKKLKEIKQLQDDDHCIDTKKFFYELESSNKLADKLIKFISTHYVEREKIELLEVKTKLIAVSEFTGILANLEPHLTGEPIYFSPLDLSQAADIYQSRLLSKEDKPND